MHLVGITLQHFRNYQQRTFLFPSQTTVIVAENARGKTSIIEAIGLLSTGNSFRAEKVDEMILFEAELARVKGKVVSEGDEKTTGEETTLEVALTRGILDGRPVQSRLYSVNDVRRRKKDFVGTFFTVVFRPEDMRLVEGSPGRRREFIDTVLSVTDPAYAFSLKTYEDTLKRRNRLLQHVQEGAQPRQVLNYWTAALLKHGQVLQEQRRQFFAKFAGVKFPIQFEVEYQPSIISQERIDEYADREVAAGHTLIGPHKDDFSVLMATGEGTAAAEKRAVSIYGSRGQQRMAVLWLKICELQFLKEKTGQQPLLLLDDILSELDQEHRQQVTSLLEHGQAIITTIDPYLVNELRKIIPTVEVVTLA